MEDLIKRIVVDPNVMVGKPTIKGTRIPVDAIIKRIAEGMTIKEILEEYPNITKKDIKATLLYSMEIVRGEEIIPMIKRKERHAVSSR